MTVRMMRPQLRVPRPCRSAARTDRFCLMPKGDESVWDIRGDLSFVHLYCTDAHLRRVGKGILLGKGGIEWHGEVWAFRPVVKRLVSVECGAGDLPADR